MQLVFYLPTFGHLLYLMFRCDRDVIESLEILWELNTAKQTLCIFSRKYRVLQLKKSLHPSQSQNANCQILDHMVRRDDFLGRNWPEAWQHGDEVKYSSRLEKIATELSILPF